jgi:phosphoribosylglycinamide formyltransferase 1
MKSLAIFASGKGSNADHIIHYLKGHSALRISLVVTSHAQAGVVQIAMKHGLPYRILDRKDYFGSGDELIDHLDSYDISGIILAGFLWLVPRYLIELYPDQIINIHPALLPAYGGKGMYGMHVHEAVWQQKEKKTGITIHQVNEKYDKGKIIFQAACAIDPEDTPLDIAQKVHQLEYRHFPRVIEEYFLRT